MLRASTLEEFRRLCEGITTGTVEEFVQDLMNGQNGPGNAVMNAGTSWHEALSCTDEQLRERIQPRRMLLAREEVEVVRPMAGADFPFVFPLEDIHLARQIMGPGRREVPGFLPIANQTICCTADHIYGDIISDAKTKFSTMSAADYEQSLQWRIYLLAHGCRKFRYCLFRMTDPTDAFACRMTDWLEFSFFSYEQMQADVEHWVRRFSDWISTRKLQPYVDQLTPALYLNRAK